MTVPRCSEPDVNAPNETRKRTSGSTEGDDGSSSNERGARTYPDAAKEQRHERTKEGTAAMTTKTNESAHYDDGDIWTRRAEGLYESCDYAAATAAAAIAQAHYAGSVAADHDRISDCVPEGGSRLQVAVQR